MSMPSGVVFGGKLINGAGGAGGGGGGGGVSSVVEGGGGGGGIGRIGGGGGFAEIAGMPSSIGGTTVPTAAVCCLSRSSSGFGAIDSSNACVCGAGICLSGHR